MKCDICDQEFANSEGARTGRPTGPLTSGPYRVGIERSPYR